MRQRGNTLNNIGIHHINCIIGMGRHIHTAVVALLVLMSATYAHPLYAQIDMDKQLRERQSEVEEYDDSDNDRHGTFHSFFLTPRTGDLQDAPVDTMRLNYFHRTLVEGLSVAEAYTGTYASPYQSKIYFDRPANRWDEFFFTLPYRHLIRNGERIQWYDTKTPYTFLKYNTVGTNEQQEQNFTFTFSSNLGKEWSLGGDVDIDYANGVYNFTASNNITYRIFSYYRGRRYQAYASMGNTNSVNQENGGITDMRYVTHPDEFTQGRRTLLPKDIPTKFKSTWNRVVFGSGRFFHKYHFGYYKSAEEESAESAAENPADLSDAEVTEAPAPELPPLDTAEPLPEPLPEPTDVTDMALQNDSIPAGQLPATPPQRKRRGKSVGQADPEKEKEEKVAKDDRLFVPVASLFHDFTYEKGTREFVSLDPLFGQLFPDPVIPKPQGARYFPNDSFNAIKISNTVGIELQEGFRKWVKMGMAAFVAYDIKRFAQPLMNKEDAIRLEIDDVEVLRATENTMYVGGRISSNSFKYFDYYVRGQAGVLGAQAGEVEVTAELNTRIPILKQEVELGGTFEFRNIQPGYYLRHFKSSLYEWDRDLMMMQMLRAGGQLYVPLTRTKLYVDFETLQNPIAPDVEGLPVQSDKNVRVLSVGLDQSLSWNIFNLETSVVWQNSSNREITPLPALSAYGNFYLKFMLAKVMTFQVGVDAKWHTAYYAPYYEPTTQAFRPQEEVEIGGKAPLLSVYANAHLKRTRFYVKYYNVGALLFDPDYFSMPYYPLYPPMIRLGVAVDLRN
ncbi:MAG: putative porin [Porphyromonas sp.]|nr:putative porin [Porphyromonas sp.]